MNGLASGQAYMQTDAYRVYAAINGLNAVRLGPDENVSSYLFRFSACVKALERCAMTLPDVYLRTLLEAGCAENRQLMIFLLQYKKPDDTYNVVMRRIISLYNILEAAAMAASHLKSDEDTAMAAAHSKGDDDDKVLQRNFQKPCAFCCASNNPRAAATHSLWTRDADGKVINNCRNSHRTTVTKKRQARQL